MLIKTRDVTGFFQRQRARLTAEGVWRTILYYGFTVLLERGGIHLMYVFAYEGDRRTASPSPGVRTAIIDSMAGLTAVDMAALRDYGGEALVGEFAAAFARGERCAVTRVAGEQLASVCWLLVDNSLMPDATPCTLIERCFTVPALRGKGLYAQMLAHLSGALSSSDRQAKRLLIKSSMFNHSSIRGIEKAGFRKIGSLRTFWGRSRYRALERR